MTTYFLIGEPDANVTFHYVSASLSSSLVIPFITYPQNYSVDSDIVPYSDGGGFVIQQPAGGITVASASYAEHAATASYFSGSISNAISASYALTASYAMNAGGGSSASASYLSGSSAIVQNLTASNAAIINGLRIGGISNTTLITAGNSLTGTLNVVVGNNAGNNAFGNSGVNVGEEAGSVASGSFNVNLGSNAGRGSNGDSNVSVGNHTGITFSGNNNVAVGGNARNLSVGNLNVAIGFSAAGQQSGSENTSVGYSAASAATGSFNTYLGGNAGGGTKGDLNTSVGRGAGNQYSGSHSVNVGESAGSVGVGDNNINIGVEAGMNGNGLSNVNIGELAGIRGVGGQNVNIGQGTGTEFAGDDNTNVGATAAYGLNGSRNIIIGHTAGIFVTGSQKLIVDSIQRLPGGLNTFASRSIIFGEMHATASVQNLRLNAQVQLPFGATGSLLGTASYALSGGATFNNTASATSIEMSDTTKIGKVGANYYFAVPANAGSGNNNLYINPGSTTTGSASSNLAIGVNALKANQSGNQNFAIGANALLQSVGGHNNFALGDGTLFSLTAGDNNIAIGPSALTFLSGSSKSNNLAIGAYAGRYAQGSSELFISNNFTGGDYESYKSGSIIYGTGINTGFSGSQYLRLNARVESPVGFKGPVLATSLDIGQTESASARFSYNSSVGTIAFGRNTSAAGTFNTTLGDFAMSNNIGTSNMAIGKFTLSSSLSGILNQAFGFGTLQNMVGGNANLGIGYNALGTLISGSTNLALGHLAGYAETGSNKLYIGHVMRDYASSSFTPTYNQGVSGSIIYGEMSPTASAQTLRFNAQVTSPYGFTGSLSGTASAAVSASRAYSSYLADSALTASYAAMATYSTGADSASYLTRPSISTNGITTSAKTGSFTISLAATWQELTYNRDIETSSYFTHANNTGQFTCSVSGWYNINLSATAQKVGGAPDGVAIRVTKNGTQLSGSYAAYSVATNNVPITLISSFAGYFTSGSALRMEVAAIGAGNLVVVPPPTIVAGSFIHSSLVTIAMM